MLEPPVSKRIMKTTRRTLATIWLAVPLTALGGYGLAVSAEPVNSESEEGTSFATIVGTQAKKTVQAVTDYIDEHPHAADIPEAYAWLFQFAVDNDLEADVVGAAERFLTSANGTSAEMQTARRIHTVGLAKSGKLEDALAAYQSYLKTARFQSANATVDVTLDLATAARMQGEFGAARSIFEQLSQKFFLSEPIRELCENRIDKLDLIGQEAPLIGSTDLHGQSVEFADLKAQVLVIDFWATDCIPCLEDFPSMRRLYEEFHGEGLEIVGISLDDNVATVEQFQQEQRLPWKLVWDSSRIDRLRMEYRVLTIPSIYIVDHSGKITQFDVRGRDLRGAVASLLNQTNR